ncbi:hypothetical protein DVH24_023459 [Malus domestica]|uniref:DYW domain-containing protein n=1 Tax=Malus domestica TaxID=3750 RepID=A0A498I520_MALDO|nr:hypothetical protein DVH24_023459 [Malus domestica]
MTGYGMHGRGEEAPQIFYRMKRVGLVPDGVTFVFVLYACCHSGMVDEGTSMSKDFGVVPGAEHRGCMVDLLGRAGRLDDTLKLIKDMPMQRTPIVWVALLSEYVAQPLSETESENDGSYTLLSNTSKRRGQNPIVNEKYWHQGKAWLYEKLALAYAILTKRPGQPIRITKNLRV